MIVEFFFNLLNLLLVSCPVLALPVGFVSASNFLVSIVGYINIVLPLVRLAPIFALIVAVRQWSIFVSLLRFILRFIPFIG